jgi:hypothetical protein
MHRISQGLFVVFLMVFGASSAASAHDVPAEVVVRVLVKPLGSRLRVLVRAPLVALQDVDFPQRGPGYLNIPDADPTLRQAVMGWIAHEIDIYEDGRRLEGQQLAAVMASLPSDRSFVDYDQAIAHVLGSRLPDDTEIVWQQVMIDALFEYPIQSDRSDFSIEAKLARLGQQTRTVLRVELPDGTIRTFDYRGNPGLVRLDPGFSDVAARFVRLGFEHIVDGVDHLLFLAVLVVPIRRLRPLAAIVTAFAIAHAVALIASAFNFRPDVLWFPALVDTLIAVSIVYVASETILGVTPKRRWLLAFLLGLVHGFGYSIGLRDTLQFAGQHVVSSLLAFSLGLELAQLLVIVVLAGVLSAIVSLYRHAVTERLVAIFLSGIAAHTAWHWLVDYGRQLMAYDIRATLPAFDMTLLAPASRWGLLLLMVATLVWLMSMVFPKMEQDGAP